MRSAEAFRELTKSLEDETWHRTEFRGVTRRYPQFFLWHRIRFPATIQCSIECTIGIWGLLGWLFGALRSPCQVAPNIQSHQSSECIHVHQSMADFLIHYDNITWVKLKLLELCMRSSEAPLRSIPSTFGWAEMGHLKLVQAQQSGSDCSADCPHRTEVLNCFVRGGAIGPLLSRKKIQRCGLDRLLVEPRAILSLQPGWDAPIGRREKTLSHHFVVPLCAGG